MKKILRAVFLVLFFGFAASLPSTSYAGFLEKIIEEFGDVITPDKKEEKTEEAVPAAPVVVEEAAEDEVAKIALLLPLSGQNAEVGKALFDSALLAVYDLPSENIEILPFDTGSDDKGAVEAAKKALSENVKLFLGPLTSSQTRAIAPLAREKNVNVISFSNDSSLAKEGVFIIGFTPEEQVRRVVRFAASKGLLNFSSFAPDNDFGRLTTEELKTTVLENSGRIENNFFYSAGSGKVDLSSVTTAVTETVDAVFIPEGGKRLLAIDKILDSKSETLSRVKLLGTGQWENNSIFEARKLSGAWFASSSLEGRKNFESYFKNIYKYDAPRITSLSYDSVALAIFLAGVGEQGDFSRASITNPRGFSAVNGIFRFREDGVSERALSIIQVGQGRFIEIEPAPKSFIQ